MHASVKRGFGVLRFLLKLLLSLENLANKGWAIRVPANFFLFLNRKVLMEKGLDAAVIPEPQVVTMFIGFKEFVAGFVSS